MITVRFFGKKPIYGFHITGHSDANPDGPEVICAGVSSAAYMTANLITEVIGLSPELSAEEGDMLLKLKTEQEAIRCEDILQGLRLHLSSLAEQYPKYIKLSYSEV